MRQEETEKLVKEGEKLGAQGEESMPDGSHQGLTPEKIDQLAEKFYDRVMEKMVTQDFATESVHEDIRIMHHLMRLKEEVGNLKTSSDTINYDNKFTLVPDDEEKIMLIYPNTPDAVLKLGMKEAGILAKVIQDQIRVWY